MKDRFDFIVTVSIGSVWGMLHGYRSTDWDSNVIKN